MAHQWLRCNLLQSDFPLLTDLFGEPVLIKGLDQTMTPDTQYQITKANEAGMVYCENVMPTSAGYQTVRFLNRNINNDPPVGSHGFVDSAYNFSAITGGQLSRMYLGASDSDFTGLYVFNTTTFTWVWVALPGAPALLFPRQISTGIVNNQCYICPGLQGLYHFDVGANNFVADPTIGIAAVSLNGITASNGLLIGWIFPNVILWSSNQNPLDFTPSLITGAGGGNIGEVKGQITYCAPISGGFIIYATQNIVQATYTGNVSFPFKFQEISGSGGTISNNQIAFHDNSDNQFAWTDKGMQAIQVGAAVSNIFPKITEFLRAGYYETFDPTTGIFTKVPANNSNPLVYINFIAGRYLIVSYGWTPIPIYTNQYSYCLVVDIETGRMGRIRFNHVDTLDVVIDTQGPVDPLARIGFITRAGVVWTLDFSLNEPGDSANTSVGLILLGKFQLQRNKGVYSQRVKLECSYVNDGSSTITVSTMPTLDGKNFLPAVACVELNTSNEDSPLKVYGTARRYGLNMSYLVFGQFNLSSLQVDLVLGAEDMRYT